MNRNSFSTLPPPDKKIPVAVILIGCFELAVSLLVFILIALRGQFDGQTIALVVILFVYGAMGAGLLAIQEWARFANVVLHMIAVPYVFFTVAYLDAPSDWRMLSQLFISTAVVFALTRPEIRYKFQTVVPKKRSH